MTREKGTVTAISGRDITLHEGTKTLAYKDAAITVADGATVTRNDATAALTDIKVGDRVSIEPSSDGTEVRAYDPTFVPAGAPGTVTATAARAGRVVPRRHGRNSSTTTG